MALDFGAWTAADVVLVALAALGVLAAALPALASTLGRSVLRFVPIDDPAAARPDDADRGFDDLYERLTAAGFEPVGAVREEAWLFQHHWYKAFTVRVLRSRDGVTLAAVYRLVPREPWRVSLETFTDDGAMARTVMPGAGVEAHGPGHSRREVPQCDLPELVEEHAHHVAEHVGRYGGVVVAVSLAERAATDERIEREQVNQMGGDHNFVWLGLALALPAYLASAVLDSTFPGLTPPTLYGAAGVLGCVTYFLFTWFVVPFLIAAEASGRNPG